jgi:transposase
MDVLYERCCGLDVHKKSVVACVLTPAPGGSGEPAKQIRMFGTMTAELLTLADWLAEQGVTHVAMESTGVYWQPVWNVLEGQFDLLLVNAQHIKAVPGRKTDVRDCEWLAQLLRHGLVRGSFVPDRPQRELRELTRYRTSLVAERTAEVNRLQTTLEGANLKLGAVAPNVLGVSGRAMLEQVVAGETDPAVLAELARGRLRQKLPQLEQALSGRVAAHHRFLLAHHLAHLDYLDERIAQVSDEIAARLRPLDDALARLDTIPGVGRRTAEVLVAEIGTDLTRFPSARHLTSWAGLCPGNHESAGKRASGRTRTGNPALRTALVEAGRAAGRSKRTYLGALYHRIAARRGAKRAAVAVGHAILTITSHLLTRQESYRDLGPLYLDQRNREVVQRRLIRRLQDLGFVVTLQPAVA